MVQAAEAALVPARQATPLPAPLMQAAALGAQLLHQPAVSPSISHGINFIEKIVTDQFGLGWELPFSFGTMVQVAEEQPTAQYRPHEAALAQAVLLMAHSLAHEQKKCGLI